MATGLGLLRLTPRDFWSMTPRELDAALRGLFGPAHAPEPLPRSTLSELMMRYPDVSSSGSSQGPSPPRTPSARA